MSSGGDGGCGTSIMSTATTVGGESDDGSISKSNINGAAAKCGALQLTPRFTQEEKEILYSLFHHHEEVIDIKFRKKQKSKFSVRDAWEQIVREFNSHQGVSAIRNLKQIQKFWLNARLRKQYPFRNIAQKNANSSNGVTQQQQQIVNHPIKDEPDFQISTESPEHNSQGEEYEEMELDGTAVGSLEEDPLDQHQQQQQQQHLQQQHVQQQAQTTVQTQQISVDQISAEKLTLNDLLQFKTVRPREEIILQIKHPGDATGAQITIPSPTRINIPTHHQPQQQQHTMATITASGYNQQIISEIKPQQITLAQYQAQQQQQLAAQQQQQQQQLAAQQQQQQQQQLAAVQQQQQQQLHQQQQQVKLQLQSSAVTQQFVSPATPTFTCTTFNTLPNVAGPTTVVPTAIATANAAGAATVAVESFEERINYFKLKEAELRYKEEQVGLEKKKIELNRAQEELKHMREMHRLHVEEVKMKIRILQEEEKQLRKSLMSHT